MLRTSHQLALTMGISISCLLLTGCGEKQEAAISKPVNSSNYLQVSNETMNAMGLTYCTVQPRLLNMTVKTTGEVQADARLVTHVNSPVTGRVTDITYQVGDRVQEGKPLCTIRSNDVEQAEADLLQNDGQVRSDLKQALLQIDSDIQTAEEQIKLSFATFKRLQDLVQEKIASQADFQAAQTQYDKDKIALATLKKKRAETIQISHEKLGLLCEPIKQKLTILGVSDKAIENVLRTRQVKAEVPVLNPESGIITERGINVGELVDPSHCLFSVGNFNRVWIQADVHEKDIAKVKEGQPIELEVDSFPGQTFKGVLNYVADALSPDTRTMTVRAQVENPGFKLKPKMFARMRILVGATDMLAVPKTAIQDAGYAKVVYVLAGINKFQERKVDLGNEIGDYVEIINGLKPGERVVSGGTFQLRSQMIEQQT